MFQDKVHWISIYQKLSEEFIEKFLDKVHWENISYLSRTIRRIHRTVSR